MTGVYIFVPAFGETVSTRTLTSVTQTAAALGSRGIMSGLSTFSFPNIADLRNMALSIWYDALPQYSHLLMVDADMGFPPELVTDMLAFGEPMVGGMYRKRQMDVEWAVSGLPKEEQEARGPFMSVEGLGFGCFLIRRDAVKTMIEHFPELVIDDISNYSLRQMIESGGGKHLYRLFKSIDLGDRGDIAEDISFCRRWRECGGKVWGAGHHVIEHVGPHIFAGSWCQWFAEEGHKKLSPTPAKLEEAAE